MPSIRPNYFSVRNGKLSGFEMNSLGFTEGERRCLIPTGWRKEPSWHWSKNVHLAVLHY